MTRRQLLIAAGGLLLTGLLALALRSWLAPSGDQLALATLAGAHGQPVERDFARTREAWQAAAEGAQFALGDGLRTGQTARATLVLFDGSQLSVMPQTTLRFLDDEQEGELAVDLEAGEAVLRASTKDLSLRSHVGLAVIKAGSEVRLERQGDALGFAVQLGSLQFQDAEGRSHTAENGDELSVGIGMAIMALAEAPEQNVEERPSGLTLQVLAPGVRRRTAAKRSWEPLSVGEQSVSPGTELRLDASGSALVTRGQDQVGLRGAGEYVLGAGDSMVETRSGELAIEAHEGDIRVGVPGGLIVVRGADAGKAKVAVGPVEGTLAVERGSVSATLNGEVEELAAGDQRDWATGAAVAGTNDSADSATPTYFNVVAPAGESFVLHSPELPVSVAIDFAKKCPGEAEVELLGKRHKVRGSGRVNLLMTSGTRNYVVRCAGSRKVAARGSVRVTLDSGTRKLPPSPPTSIVEADGLTYTIYYPNQLPAIDVRWPNAPEEKSYQLDVDGKVQTIPKPQHLFKSGALRDGTHKVSFRGTTRRSRTTTIIVRFDNNAPTASLISPADRSFSPGEPVKVQGVSLQAWKVSLEGGTLTKEPDGRFAGTVTPTAANPDVVVRLSHPRLGIHYYLRRAASSQ